MKKQAALVAILALPSLVFAGPAPSSTQLNQAISNVLGGGYVGAMFEEVFASVSDFWLGLPFDIEPVGGQIAHILQKESARLTRSLLSRELGLGSLSVAHSEPGSSFVPSSSLRHGGSHPLSLKTSVSSRRLALSLIFRF